MKQKCQDLRAALASNKDDTKYIYELWAEAREEIEKLKERVAYAEKCRRNATIYAEVITPIPGLMLMTYGFIEMGIGNTDFGWRMFSAGAITLVSLELVYNGGRWVFNIW